MRCPECGDRVPVGGKQTVQNAHRMLVLARVLRERLIPEGHPEYDRETGPKSQSFVNEGLALGTMLHEHGHKRLPESMWPTMNDWAIAGGWMNRATHVARNIGVS